jgi:hypothetical protein
VNKDPEEPAGETSTVEQLKGCFGNQTDCPFDGEIIARYEGQRWEDDAGGFRPTARSQRRDEIFWGFHLTKSNEVISATATSKYDSKIFENESCE